ncbi:MAG: uncharacterized protein QOI86_2937 [Actinomycetota bacterium]|nr:uncharacterized protein [Actinomycetota bacterium]
MKVAITGASGFIGSSLGRALGPAGYDVVPVVRRRPGPGEIGWDPVSGDIDPDGLAGVDAVIHLAAENVATWRWNDPHKRRILDSRVTGTRTLATALARLPRPPGVLVSASAIAFYGDRGAAWLTEASGAGSGFGAEVCQAWEAATEAARSAGIRVVHLRTGIVLDRRGGALRRLLPVFRFGLGGRYGSGTQYMSWISLDDELRAIRFVLGTDGVSGPVNLTAPEPVTNAAFTAALAGVLRRPAVLGAPAGLLRVMLGREMADELLLTSQRVRPEVLLDHGFAFRHPGLDAGLAAALAPAA